MNHFDAQVWSFFEDDQFIQWVRFPDAALDAYWNDWMKNHPDRIDDLLRAKALARQMASAHSSPSEEDISNEIWEKISAGINPPEPSLKILQPSVKRRRSPAVAAAAVLLLLIGSVSLILIYRQHSAGSRTYPVISMQVNDRLQHQNRSPESRIVYLVDGTKITLQPGASVSHATFLQKDKREVYLEGDAFFEVAKDPNRPFYVYAHDIVLRVLGTSFHVSTDKSNGNITVLVKTGKVSVYKNHYANRAEFILTPNQMVHYTAGDQSLVRSQAGEQELSSIPAAAQGISFNFEETPVPRIFEKLQDAYGISIHYDQNLFEKCSLTTSLNDVSFEDKLKIICEALNATYMIQNNEVSITGKGCK